MATQRSVRQIKRGRQSRRPGPRQVLVVVGVAVVATIVLIALGTARQSGSRAELPSQGQVLGRADAPVTIDEWGDFQ